MADKSAFHKVMTTRAEYIIKFGKNPNLVKMNDDMLQAVNDHQQYWFGQQCKKREEDQSRLGVPLPSIQPPPDVLPGDHLYGMKVVIDPELSDNEIKVVSIQ